MGTRIVCLQVHVWQEVEQDRVVAIRCVPAHNKERGQWRSWVTHCILSAEAVAALYQEEELSHLDPVPVHRVRHGPLLPPPGGQLNNYLVNEALLARIEEGPEVAPKVSEKGLDETCLVPWRKLRVEVSRLDDQVEIVFECRLSVDCDIPVQIGRHEHRPPRVCCFLKFQDPNVEVH